MAKTRTILLVVDIIALILLGAASTSFSFRVQDVFQPILADWGVENMNVQNGIILAAILAALSLLFLIPGVRKAIFG